MAKKILAGCLAAVILIGLAWYAGFLHSDQQAKREQSELWQELRSLAGRIEAQEEQQAEARQLQEERTEASVDPDGVVNEQGVSRSTGLTGKRSLNTQESRRSHSRSSFRRRFPTENGSAERRNCMISWRITPVKLAIL